MNTDEEFTELRFVLQYKTRLHLFVYEKDTGKFCSESIFDATDFKTEQNAIHEAGDSAL